MPTSGRQVTTVGNVDDACGAIRTVAGLFDLRRLDLRHAFASAADTGEGPLAAVSAHLGHSEAKTNQRYFNLPNDQLRRHADMAPARIALNRPGFTGG